MSVHNQQEVEMGGGVAKGIQASAMKMILDNLQKYQYQFPIKSTVRELVSNSVDAVAERDVAKKLLSGEGKVEDYYVEIEGEEYEDSKFDPSYYDLKWLSDVSSVQITYIVGKSTERDKVIIADEGVGLGSYRLEKYFSLGYSTKRLSKILLGKFGIGGKAALSIGEPYYTMESRYNGRLYRFNIYSHTFDSIVPSFDLTSGKENEFVIFNEGTPQEYKVYYENTHQLNGVQVTITAKKTHKQQYIDAVKSQLLYFDNVKFDIIDNNDGEIKAVNFQAHILYEDDYIVLSDNEYWAKPHLLLNRVNYGYINFAELELEEKAGNIGIKIAPEDVDINPSRESIIWSDMTKQMVLNRFKTVVDIASSFIQEQLKETDYLNWIRACYNITGKAFSDKTTVGRLARIVDLSDVKPSFTPEPRLRFQQTKVFNGLYVREVSIQKRTVANRWRYQVTRYERKTMTAGVINMPIFLVPQGERANNRKDKYLASLFPQGFLLVNEPLSSMDQLIKAGATVEAADHILSLFNKEGEEGRISLGIVWKYLTESQAVTWYDRVDVPSHFKATEEEVDEEDMIDPEQAEKEAKEVRNRQNRIDRLNQARVARTSAAERRKASGKMLMYTPRANRIHTYNGTMTEPQRAYDWQKLEVQYSEMNDWEEQEIYYSAGPQQDPLMHLVAMITRDPYYENTIGGPFRAKAFKIGDKNKEVISLSEWAKKAGFTIGGKMPPHGEKDWWEVMNCQHFYDNKEIKLIKTSIANSKYVQDFQSIEEFFSVIKNKTLTMSNILIRWNTARIIKDRITNAAFLHNFDTFNDQYSKMYGRLCNYVNENYREVSEEVERHFFGLDRSTYLDLVAHLDKVQQFQEFVATDPTDTEIAEMAHFMFGNKELTDGHAVDPHMMHILTLVINYSNAIGPMFNYMPIFTGGVSANVPYKKGLYRPKITIPMELETSVKDYLDSKGLLDYNEKEMEELETHLYGEEVEVVTPKTEKAVLLPPDKYVAGVDPYKIDEPSVNVYKVHRATPTEGDEDLEIPRDQQIIQSF